MVNSAVAVYSVKWYTMSGDKEHSVREVSRLQNDMIKEVFLPWTRGLCPGGQVYVSHKGKLVFSECFGYSDIEREVKIDETTVFHAASVSKQITCICVLLLWERGLVDINADVREYLPDLIAFKEPVTIRDLMNNISGIRDQWELQMLSGVRMDDLITQSDLLELIARQKSLNFPPRSKYLYSNSNFTLLAEIITRISGLRLNEFAKKNVFEPLGMTHTFIRERFDDPVKNRALSYVDCGNSGFKWKPLNYSNCGATSLHTTAPDFLKWLVNFRNPRLITKETLEQMLTVPALTTDEKTNYACGVNVRTYRERRMISHSGADAGYRSMALTFPDEELDIVILANVENIYIEPAALAVADIMLGYGTDTGFVPNEKLFREEQRDPADYAGEFLIEALGATAGLRQDGTETMFYFDDKAHTLSRLSGNCFSAGAVKLYLCDDGAYFSVRPETGFKLAKKSPAIFSENDLIDIPGKYFSDELETYYEIIRRDNKLFMRHKRFGCAEILTLESGLYGCALEYFIKFKLIRSEEESPCGISVVGDRVTEISLMKADIVIK